MNKQNKKNRGELHLLGISSVSRASPLQRRDAESIPIQVPQII